MPVSRRGADSGVAAAAGSAASAASAASAGITRAGIGRGRGAAGPSPVTGMAHRKVGARDVARIETVVATGGPTDAVTGSDDRTVMRSGSKATTTVPSWSVRRTRAPDAARRSSVAFAGWPYGLSAPAEATATVGRVASTNAWVVAVRLP